MFPGIEYGILPAPKTFAAANDSRRRPTVVLNKKLKLALVEDLVIRADSCGIDELPDQLYEKPKLRELILSRNNLYEFPGSLCRCITRLRVLRLDNNNLTFIPPEISFLRKLQQLDLMRNKITYVPVQLGMLQDLQQVNLFENPLTELLGVVMNGSKDVSLNQENSNNEMSDQTDTNQPSETFDGMNSRVAFINFNSKNYFFELYHGLNLRGRPPSSIPSPQVSIALKEVQVRKCTGRLLSWLRIQFDGDVEEELQRRLQRHEMSRAAKRLRAALESADTDRIQLCLKEATTLGMLPQHPLFLAANTALSLCMQLRRTAKEARELKAALVSFYRPQDPFAQITPHLLAASSAAGMGGNSNDISVSNDIRISNDMNIGNGGGFVPNDTNRSSTIASSSLRRSRDVGANSIGHRLEVLLVAAATAAVAAGGEKGGGERGGNSAYLTYVDDPSIASRTAPMIGQLTKAISAWIGFVQSGRGGPGSNGSKSGLNELMNGVNELNVTGSISTKSTNALHITASTASAATLSTSTSKRALNSDPNAFKIQPS
eukprot:CAMPEP_0175079620 /NCGR_PEP_ID=MMETSP0052_2-20121109/24931_1 /TAXON_ID=51329 ORGANISM="Polytomella parva, Strain SAG 63-3" /NCGR_SAMPLE_ID=MMETSP0052_2 /ASSEMBLY_ACC=CAM_ASM_000194 /LENGTH=545 /DNA_ID=CAMNT_0016349985 /DNA_START=9 /DNA_END=1643 /DNA_ORIENTATION=-